jgi:hypothetical protein
MFAPDGFPVTLTVKKKLTLRVLKTLVQSLSFVYTQLP